MEIANVNENYLYEQLWKLCAGPKVDLPKIGEQVYYFPQGHIELIEEAAREKLNHIQSTFDLPSKFRCRVIDIQLKAIKDNDEVYAQITLVPDKTQVVIPTQNNHGGRPIVDSFTKVLTASDTNIHGVLSIPIRDASECFPPLDVTNDSATQEFIAKDLHGNEWKFKHSFKGSPRRHLLTTGWSAFVAAKKIVAGDAVVFLSLRGEKRKVRVGIRRAKHQQRNIASPLISFESMRHGVISSAKHAFQNNCMFTVVYNPRSRQFIVRYDKYMDSMNNKLNTGSKFSMRCEANDLCEREYSGTIIRVNNFSSLWKNSEWRSLQVNWDNFSPFQRPHQISPWEIEHLTSSKNVLKPNLLKNKRSREMEIGSTSSYACLPTSTKSQKNGKGKEVQRNEFSSTRNCIKVEIQGDTIGRALDLSVLSGYDQLIRKLEELFDLKGQLHNHNKWEIVFKDNEGDLMLLGDHPWTEFCSIVERIFIRPKNKIKNLNYGIHINENNTDNVKEKET